MRTALTSCQIVLKGLIFNMEYVDIGQWYKPFLRLGQWCADRLPALYNLPKCPSCRGQKCPQCDETGFMAFMLPKGRSS